MFFILFYLAVGRILHHREYLPVGGHVPVVGRQVVHVETLGVQLLQRNVCRADPVCLQRGVTDLEIRSRLQLFTDIHIQLTRILARCIHRKD
jgi:hypothetical protein